jgi:hypothetical protein
MAFPEQGQASSVAFAFRVRLIALALSVRAGRSRGVGSLTRRLSRSPRRRHPACGTRPEHAPAPAHARPARRTGTRTASARGWPTSLAQPGHPAWQDAPQTRRTEHPSARRRPVPVHLRARDRDSAEPDCRTGRHPTAGFGSTNHVLTETGLKDGLLRAVHRKAPSTTPTAPSGTPPGRRVELMIKSGVAAKLLALHEEQARAAASAKGDHQARCGDRRSRRRRGRDHHRRDHPRIPDTITSTGGRAACPQPGATCRSPPSPPPSAPLDRSGAGQDSPGTTGPAFQPAPTSKKS